MNDSKNPEFEFLTFKTETKLLQNFSETTHWKFPWYPIDVLSLISDTSTLGMIDSGLIISDCKENFREILP